MTKGIVHILNADALKLPLPDNSVDLIITHPPYLNVDTTRYGGESKKQINQSQNEDKMLKLLMKATKEMYRVLKPTGSLWIANGPLNMFDARYALSVNEKTDFYYIDKVVQNSYTKDSTEAPPFQIASRDATTWYHFSKGDNLYYNPYEVKRNRDPVWALAFNNMADPIDRALEMNHFVSDTMNSEIPKRLIKMFSKSGHVVLDPFGGSALVAVSAAELDRVGISGDISRDMTKAAVDRCVLSGIEYTIDQKFI